MLPDASKASALHASDLLGLRTSSTTELTRSRSTLDLLRIGLGLVVGHLLHTRPRHDFLVPRVEMRELLCDVRRVPLGIHQQPDQIPVPRHKGQVGKGDLVSDQILGALLLQVPIDDAGDTLDLVAVAVDGGLDALLRVEEAEPGFLAEVGALARDLEVQPREGGVFFFQGGVVQGLRLVVLVDEVFDDGAGLVEGC